MPAIQVARTDTFEQQRQKINQIGEQIFNVTAGGSDLSTGNLKLGDGTRENPSLAFVSDSSLGVYKPTADTLGFVSRQKKLIDFSSDGLFSFKDIVVRQTVLSTEGISILDFGSNYDAGTYSDVILIGGTGDNATANIIVTEFTGEITNSGSNYNEGSFSNVSLTGGSGSGAIASFDVEGISGVITNTGSGYVPGVYSNISLNGGSGSGATADITVDGEVILSGSITNPGSNYLSGTYEFVSVFNEPRQTFIVTNIGDVVYIDGLSQPSLNLEKGNTYRFDLSDSSNSGHNIIFRTLTSEFLDTITYAVIDKGTPGSPGAFTDFIIKPNAVSGTIQYDCQFHSGNGNTITISDGTIGEYGTFALSTVEVDNSGQVSTFTITSSGQDYKVNDIVSFSADDIGGIGSGFSYTIQSITYTGQISQIDISDNGQDYLVDDVLTVNNSDIGGFGSGFLYTVTSNPGQISNFSFSSKGSGYQINDLLYLPTGVSGLSTTLKGRVDDVSTTLSDTSPIIIVPSTTGIVAGMSVFNTGITDVGFVDGGTTVLSVDSSTQITLSALPTTSGSATLTFLSDGTLSEISVSSTDGILSGFVVSQTSGTGILGSGVTVNSVNTDTNTITLSQNPVQAGSAVLNFSPPFGNPLQSFEYQVNLLGVIDDFSISDGGNGYSLLDNLSVNSRDLTQPITLPVINRNLQEITFTQTLPASTFSIGDRVKIADGNIITFDQTSVPDVTPVQVNNINTTLSTSSPVIAVSSTSGITSGMIVTQDFQNSVGFLALNTTVLSVDSSTQITLSANPTVDGSAVLNFSTDESGSYVDVQSTTDGSGSGATFNIQRTSSGTVSEITISSPGIFYEDGDTVTISGSDVGGVSPSQDIVLTITSVNTSQLLEVYDVKSNGSDLSSILVDYLSIVSGDKIIKELTTSPIYDVDVASDIVYKFFIDAGSGYELTPDLTFYIGSTYNFELSDPSNVSHLFSLSQFRDGIWNPSLIENVTAVLDTNSQEITVSSSIGILPGMAVTVITGPGALVSNTLVSDVSGNIVTLDKSPLTSGTATLLFSGVEYTNGVVRTETSLSIKVTEETPNLYYYCGIGDPVHSNEGGDDNAEALISIDPNNPKVFGSDFLASVADILSDDVIVADIETGNLTAKKFLGENAEINDASINSLSASSINGSDLTVSNISSQSNLLISASNGDINLTSNFVNIGSNIQINTSNGNITTSGTLKTTGTLNVNDTLSINNNNISTSSGNNIQLSPPVGRVAKINSTTALTIPAGTTSQRPTSTVVENGSIRFNTDTNQYEGYSASTSSWASLGGVRDLDGNTTVLAEEFVGANDNTLWFINDNINTIRFTPEYQEFVSVKKVRSVNTQAPNYVEWTANTSVTAGEYLKYENNIFEVIISGTTGTSGNEPTDTSGSTFTNGTATLRYFTSAVSTLTFEEISELRIAPRGGTPLSINGDLRLSDNVISTDISDLLIRPNSGKKVIIDSSSTLAIPSGPDTDRGIPIQGSIRFSTTTSQFEGYDGTNWGSLGGVKDVDQNTYIIPELSPGSNENILYFYNDNNNTLQLTTTSLDFYSIDTIRSVTTDEFEITASLLTFDNGTSTFDNTATDRTFLHTTKQYFDIGLSAGLTSDPVLRLDDQGDVYLNIGFGSGVFDGVKVFDNELKEFELADVRIFTDKLTLVKGTSDNGSSELYPTASNNGCKTTIVAHNTTSGDKEFIEFGIIDDGVDVFHTEYGNIRTGTQLIIPTFEVTGSNVVRINITLGADINPTESVNIIVVSNITKK